MDRINKLCSFVPPCKVFADVGCDHGYCAKYMLDNGLCESAIVSDISPKSLEKAERLLSGYKMSGKCRAVCCDGLEKIVGADGVMIAGMGGEEIIKILKNAYIPQVFTFQPMKNAEKLRKFLAESGCTFLKDDIFSSGGKYYFVIVGARGGQDGARAEYTADEFAFGKDSLKNPIIKDYLKKEIQKLDGYLLRGPSEKTRGEVLERRARFTEVLNGIE